MMKELIDNKLALIGFLVVIMANPLWPFWGFFRPLAYFLFPFLLFVSLIQNRKSLKLPLTQSQLFIVFVYICVFLLIPTIYTIRLSSYLFLLTYLSILMLSDENKSLIFKCITRFLALVIGVSLPLWFIHVFLIQLPLFGILTSIISIKDIEPMHNYIFFVMNGGVENGRFYSMFDEPGVLGTLSAFVLFANGYNFKKIDNIIILLGAIFTFSLAFYLLFIIGIVLFYSKKTTYLIFSIICLSILSYGLYFFLKDNLIFQITIVERFADISQSANERSSEYINDFFSSYIKSTDAILGLGTSFFSTLGWSEGSSYKDFLLEYGILGAFTLISMYFSLLKNINRNCFILFILFFVSFIQRPLAFTSWQILLFACCCANLNKEVSVEKRK